MDLIDSLYESGILGISWSETLDKLARRFQTTSAYFVGLKALEPVFLMANPSGMERVRRVLQNRSVADITDLQPDLRVRRLIERRHSGFVADFDLLSEREIADSRASQALLVPHGHTPGAAMLINDIDGYDVFISLEGFRSYEACKAAIPALDQIRPHLSRAAALTTRMNLQRARSMTEALNMIGMAACIVTHSGRIRTANAQFGKLFGAYIHESADRLKLKNPSLDLKFHTLLTEMRLPTEGAKSLPLTAYDDTRPLVMHLLPMNCLPREDAICGAVLVVIGGTAKSDMPESLLQQLFNLTAAEARLAQQLAKGQSLEDIVQTSGRSIHTLRTQTKSILAKTGINSQKALVALLHDMALGHVWDETTL